MSRREENGNATVEELLQKYEREESAVLRAELVAFLKSPECQAELEKTVRKPIETIVLGALNSTKFQEQVRNAVLESLRPEIVKAAQAAAKSALSDIKVAIPEEAQARMRRDAEELVRKAYSHAQRDTPPPARSRVLQPGSTPNKLMLGGLVAAILAIAGAVYYFYGRGGADRMKDPVAVEQVLPETTPPAPEPVVTRGSALFAQYQNALPAFGPPGLPAPKGAELACIERSIEQVESGGRFDVAALRALLNNCAAVSARPAAPSRIIAGVQAQLTEEARAGSCSALQPVTIDGRHGNETSAALSTYVGCTSPAGVPGRLETLGDYAAVGVYFIHKRMRDTG